jgi:two-component system sensor histidine kinase CpxA
MNEMIGKLLTLSRIEGVTDLPDRVEIELATLVQDVADDTDFEARDQGRSVRVIESSPTTVNGVPELVRSAIENVVRNACDTPQQEPQWKSPSSPIPRTLTR